MKGYFNLEIGDLVGYMKTRTYQYHYSCSLIVGFTEKRVKIKEFSREYKFISGRVSSFYPTEKERTVSPFSLSKRKSILLHQIDLIGSLPLDLKRDEDDNYYRSEKLTRVHPEIMLALVEKMKKSDKYKIFLTDNFLVGCYLISDKVLDLIDTEEERVYIKLLAGAV